MDKISSNIYLNLIGIVLAAAFVKMHIKNNIRDREIIILKFGIEKKIVIFQFVVIIAVVEGIAKYLGHRISFQIIIGNLYWITFAILFFIVSGRKIVVTNNGLAYRYWLGNLNYVFFWNTVESYYLLSYGNNNNKNKITISYLNERFRIKRLNLYTNKKIKKKFQNILKEYVIEDNNASNIKVTIKNQ